MPKLYTVYRGGGGDERRDTFHTRSRAAAIKEAQEVADALDYPVEVEQITFAPLTMALLIDVLNGDGHVRGRKLIATVHPKAKP